MQCCDIIGLQMLLWRMLTLNWDTESVVSLTTKHHHQLHNHNEVLVLAAGGSAPPTGLEHVRCGDWIWSALLLVCVVVTLHCSIICKFVVVVLSPFPKCCTSCRTDKDVFLTCFCACLCFFLKLHVFACVCPCWYLKKMFWKKLNWLYIHQKNV